MTKWRTYYQTLTREQRKAYAEAAGTTTGHIENHLVSRKKMPRKELMSSLAAASNGQCSLLDVLTHFYGDQVSDDGESAA